MRKQRIHFTTVMFCFQKPLFLFLFFLKEKKNSFKKSQLVLNSLLICYQCGGVVIMESCSGFPTSTLKLFSFTGLHLKRLQSSLAQKELFFLAVCHGSLSMRKGVTGEEERKKSVSSCLSLQEKFLMYFLVFVRIIYFFFFYKDKFFA